MKKMFLSLGASMLFLFVLSFHSLAANSAGNGSSQPNQGEPSANVNQYQFQQENPMNENGSGAQPEAPAGARNGALDGAGPFLNITGAIPLDVTGTVVSCLQGNGLELQIGDGESIYIFGIGPNWFWEGLDIEKPFVGEVIQVVGFTVDYSGTLRNIATSITFLEEDPIVTIGLRDESGYPIWRNGRALRIGQASQTTP